MYSQISIIKTHSQGMPIKNDRKISFILFLSGLIGLLFVSQN